MAPLTVTIIGAGIAGLTAALCLRKQGHKVTILEKSAFNQELGAAIHVGANVSGILARLGFDLKKNGANLCEGMIRFGTDGELVFRVDGLAEKIPNWYLIHRVDLHTELKRLALDPQGDGPTPDLLLGCRIVQIDSEKGTVRLDDGKVFVSDVIVGADGNKSASRLEIKPDAKLFPWGKNCYRWLTPKGTLVADPETVDLIKLRGYFGELYGPDRRIILYPCRNNTMINCAAFVSRTDAQEFDGGNKALVEKAFSHFSAGTRKMVTYADDDLKAWELFDMNVMPKWHKDKLVLIGDAAHPYLPFLGQGGAMAIEDAVCLGVLLPRDTPSSEVPERLKLYQDIRYERANELQQGSRVNGVDEDVRPKDWDVNKALAKSHNYNEWANSEEKLQAWLKQRKTSNGTNGA